MAEGGVNTVELVAKLINQGSNLIDGIERMFDKIEGSCSLLLLHKDSDFDAIAKLFPLKIYQF